MNAARLRTWWGWQHRGYVWKRQRRALLLFILLITLLAVGDLSFALNNGVSKGYVDLRIWRDISRGYFADTSVPLYETYPSYLYPPFFITLIGPLFELPDNIATALFQTLKWAALIMACWLTWRLCSPRGEDLPPAVTVGSFLLAARFFENSLKCGNINMFIFLAVVAAAWLAQRGKLGWAGFIAGVAACTKVTPALLIAYFVYKGWWRALIGVAVAAVVCLLIYPALFLGWESNLRQLAGWWDYLPRGFLAEGRVNSFYWNQSLPAILNRLVGPAAAFPPDICVAPFILPAWALTTIRSLLLVGGLGGLAYACRRRFDPQSEPLAYATEIGLLLIATLALSGIAWKAHFVVMLLPFAVLLAYLADARYPSDVRRKIRLWLIVAGVLCLGTSDILTPRGANLAELFGLLIIGALAAAIGLLIVQHKLAARRATAALDETPLPRCEGAVGRLSNCARAADGTTGS